MILNYLVRIGWRQEFMFDDPEDATTFAVMAAKNRTACSDQDTIGIDIINVDDPEPKPVRDPEETPVGGDEE